MDDKKKHTTPEERIELWVDLVRDVVDQLPVTNKAEFIDLCLEAYDKNGYAEEFDNPFFVCETYAMPRWKRIINEVAHGKNGIFIKFVRDRDGHKFAGQWKRVYKREYVQAMEKEARGIATRIENYTYNKELAQDRWKNLPLPGFEVLQLPG